MLKKTKRLKVEPVDIEEMKTDFSYVDTLNPDNTSAMKIDPDSSVSCDESLLSGDIDIKEEPYTEIIPDNLSSTSPITQDNKSVLNIEHFSEEIDLNPENEDSDIVSLEANSTEPGAENVKKKRKKRQMGKKKLTLAEESALRQQKLISNHPVRKPCENCRIKCCERITLENRQKTNNEFWNLVGLVNRRSYILNLVKRTDIKRRTKSYKSNKIRNNVFLYYMKDSDGKKQQVCKRFFLATLGFKPSNDSIILSTLQNVNKETLEPKMDMRGKTRNPDKIDSRKKIIQQYIETFHPFVFHFRREDLPNKRYLPSELTIKDLHADFIKKNFAQRACSYEFFRAFLTEMNVSLAKVGADDCDTCEIFNKHDSSHNRNDLSPDCDICHKWSIHMERDSEAKNRYQKLQKEVPYNTDTAYYTTDLQKPLGLPRLDSIDTLTTRRLVVFNKSFIPFGAIENVTRPLVFLWHEAVAGREDEEIVSVFYQFFLECRDKRRIVLCLDDSFHQNKNWKFLTFLIYIVNSSDVETECVEIYYFEAGHGCPGTETFFHQVEVSLKRKGKIYDFKDFENAVKQANSKNINFKSMTPWDFREFKDFSSPQKLKTLNSKPLINDIRYLKAERGSYTLKYRMNYDENLDAADLDFLQMKVAKFGFSRPEIVGSYRGIPEDKKKEIIENLVKQMPASRRQFWYDLPEGDFLDLLENYSST